MSDWSSYPTAAPGLVPTWKDPPCACGHTVHESHCPVVACGCFVAPPECTICPHRAHDDKDCYALGVRNPCPCKGPNRTTKEQYHGFIFGPEWRNRR